MRYLRPTSLAEASAGNWSCAPDRVLLDLMLPDGCGTEVLRRARRPGRAARVRHHRLRAEKLDKDAGWGHNSFLKSPSTWNGSSAAMTA